MEYYKLVVPDGDLPMYIIVGNGEFSIYNENMKKTNYYKQTWNKFTNSRLLSKYSLITDEDELAKLLLVCKI